MTTATEYALNRELANQKYYLNQAWETLQYSIKKVSEQVDELRIRVDNVNDLNKSIANLPKDSDVKA